MPQTGQRPTVNQTVLQLTSIPTNCLDGLIHCIWTHNSESQRGDDVRQVEFRSIMASNGKSMAKGFVRYFRKISRDQDRLQVNVSSRYNQ